MRYFWQYAARGGLPKFRCNARRIWLLSGSKCWHYRRERPQVISILWQQFDLIYSSAVLEHLAMPWVAAQEIQKSLKVGGHLIIETHFTFSSHDRPWHFFQFSDIALRALFLPPWASNALMLGLAIPLSAAFRLSQTPIYASVPLDLYIVIVIFLEGNFVTCPTSHWINYHWMR